MKNKAFDHSKYQNWIDPKEVKPYEMNAKQHTEKQIKNICTSIRRFGWQQDTVLTTDNVLVIGHGRRLAALKLGCEMPYHVIDKTADELTDEDIRELRIADNQTNSETGYDFDIMSAEIEDLTFKGFDFDISYDGIDMLDAMQDDFGIAGVSNKMGTVTLTFDTDEEAEEVRSYIRKNKQEELLAYVLDFVRRNNA